MTITPRNMFEQYLQTPVDFNSLEELVNLPFVKLRSDRKDFYRFSVSNGKSKLLLVEYNEGKEWWVVGYLSEAIEGLPEWFSPKTNTECKHEVLPSQIHKATYTGMYMEGFN